MNNFAKEKIEYYNKRLEEYQGKIKDSNKKIEELKKEIESMEEEFKLYLIENKKNKRHYNDFKLLLDSSRLDEFLFYSSTVDIATIEEMKFLLQRLTLKKQLRQYKINLSLFKNILNKLNDIIKEFKKYGRCLTETDSNNRIYTDSIMVNYL